MVDGLASHPRVRAVGETGLDYYRTRDEAGQAVQREAFAAHIAMAKAHGRTLVVHDRDAHSDILDVLDSEGPPDRLVMHCFSGDADFARACVDRGAYLSFAGPVTFKPNEPLRAALAITPLDRVLVETDAPYLTPMPFRGRPNASYLVPHTVRFMADTLALDLELLGQALGRQRLGRLRRGVVARWSSARCCAAGAWCGRTPPTRPVPPPRSTRCAQPRYGCRRQGSPRPSHCWY